MAIYEVPGGMTIPFPPLQYLGNDRWQNLTLDGTNTKVAFIIQAPKSGVLDHVEWRVGTVTQNPSNGVKISFQDIDTSTGLPDGTIDEYQVQTGFSSNTWFDTGAAMTDDGTVNGNKRHVTRGDLIAVVFEFAGYASGDALEISALKALISQEPSYSLQYISGTWSKESYTPNIAMRYTDLSYETSAGMGMAASDFGYHDILEETEPDEMALCLSFSAPVRVGAMWASAIFDTFAQADIVLYAPDGDTELASIHIDQKVSASDVTTDHYRQYSLPSDVRLEANEIYRLSIRPVVGAGQVSVFYFDTDNEDIMDGMFGGQRFFYSERFDGGTWQDITTRRPFIGVVVTGIDHDTSGGSSGGGWEGNP